MRHYAFKDSPRSTEHHLPPGGPLWPVLQSGDNVTLVIMMSQYLTSLLLYINSLTTNDPNLVKINPLDRINMSSLLEF